MTLLNILRRNYNEAFYQRQWKQCNVSVTYDVRRKKWKATICVNYKQVQLGRFNTQREAFEARVKAEKEHNFKDIQEWKGETNFEY